MSSLFLRSLRPIPVLPGSGGYRESIRGRSSGLRSGLGIRILTFLPFAFGTAVALSKALVTLPGPGHSSGPAADSHRSSRHPELYSALRLLAFPLSIMMTLAPGRASHQSRNSSNHMNPSYFPRICRRAAIRCHPPLPGRAPPSVPCPAPAGRGVLPVQVPGLGPPAGPKPLRRGEGPQAPPSGCADSSANGRPQAALLEGGTRSPKGAVWSARRLRVRVSPRTPTS
jgi:hypothetical protein